METIDSLFLDNPDIFRDESGENIIEIIESGIDFETIFEGKRQKIRPFTGYLIDKDKFTEIIVGFITEKNKISYYGIKDYGQRENYHLYPKILEAMYLVYSVKELNGYTCEYCYLAVRKCDKFLIDGEFFNSETKKTYELKKYLEAKKAIKKRTERLNLVLYLVIVIVIIVIAVIIKLDLHF